MTVAGPRRLLWSALGLLALVALGATLFTGLHTGEQNPTTTATGPVTQIRDASAPTLAGTTLDGKPFNLADLRGQVVVVNVWASWCAPCRSELPLLAAAQKRWADRGLHIVGVDVRDTATAARQLLTETGATNLSVVADPQGTAAVAWGVRGVPETFLLDRDGRIRAWVQGGITADWLATWIPPRLGS